MAVVSLVAAPPLPGETGTTMRVTEGTGSLFGSPPFLVVVLPVDAVPSPFNAEVVLVRVSGGNEEVHVAVFTAKWAAGVKEHAWMVHFPVENLPYV